jgi:hypothetical protein
VSYLDLHEDRIRALAADGKSPRDIAKLLRAEGVRTPKEKKSEWTFGAVDSMTNSISAMLVPTAARVAKVEASIERLKRGLANAEVKLAKLRKATGPTWIDSKQLKAAREERNRGIFERWKQGATYKKLAAEFPVCAGYARDLVLKMVYEAAVAESGYDYRRIWGIIDPVRKAACVAAYERVWRERAGNKKQKLVNTASAEDVKGIP